MLQGIICHVERVIRRVGGLEMLLLHQAQQQPVIRRVGGLENLQLS